MTACSLQTSTDTVVLAMTASRPRPTRKPRLSRSSRDAAPSARTRALCTFAAAMARGLEKPAAAALELARAAGVRRRAAEECALMLMLYAGYPGALEGMRVLNSVWPGRARATREGSPASWHVRGTALCQRVYGPAYARLVPAVRALHPDLAVWMVEQGYGRVLSRRGLGVIERELVTVAALAALGWERQLVSHVLGARRVGASERAIHAALQSGAAHADARCRTIARRTWVRAQRAAAVTAR